MNQVTAFRPLGTEILCESILTYCQLNPSEQIHVLFAYTANAGRYQGYQSYWAWSLKGRELECEIAKNYNLYWQWMKDDSILL